MPTQWPNGILTFPFSGILSGYKIHPYHVSDLYNEISGIEQSIGFNPAAGAAGWSSLTQRISGIESGYARTFTNVGTGSGVYSSQNQSGINLKSLVAGSNITITATTTEITIASTAAGGSSITTPSVTNNSGIPRWSGVTGGGFIDSRWIIDPSDVIRPLISGNGLLGTQANPLSGVYSVQYATIMPITHSGIFGAAAVTSVGVDWNLGSSQRLIFNPGLSGNVSINLSNGIAGSSYAFVTTQNPSGTTNLAWQASVKWQGGVSGTMTASGNAVDLFNFWFDGTNYLGNYGLNYK